MRVPNEEPNDGIQNADGGHGGWSGRFRKGLDGMKPKSADGFDYPGGQIKEVDRNKEQIIEIPREGARKHNAEDLDGKENCECEHAEEHKDGGDPHEILLEIPENLADNSDRDEQRWYAAAKVSGCLHMLVDEPDASVQYVGNERGKSVR